MKNLKTIATISLLLTFASAHSTLLDCDIHGIPIGNASPIGNETYKAACFRVNGNKPLAKSASHAIQHGISTNSIDPPWLPQVISINDPDCFNGHKSVFGIGGTN